MRCAFCSLHLPTLGLSDSRWAPACSRTELAVLEGRLLAAVAAVAAAVAAVAAVLVVVLDRTVAVAAAATKMVAAAKVATRYSRSAA